MPMWTSASFQNLLSYNNSGLESLHDLVMVWLILILVVVSLVSLGAVYGPSAHLPLDSAVLEQIWTVLPMLVLFSVAWPSLYLLSLQDFLKNQPSFSVKVISNQWNWTSETTDEDVDHLIDVEEVTFLSSLESPSSLVQSLTRLVISSGDVLHSLGIPSLGVKLDSVPGRLNSTTLVPLQGLHIGSCYELCGSGHSAMPISFLVA